MFKNIAVIGLGYIGLPTAAMFASRKVNVLGVDVNPHAVETINNGDIHIVEPELDIVVHSTVTEGYLKASLTPAASDAFLIAVPTPFKDDKQPDLAYIESAAKSIGPFLKKGDLVILESTSPVGATEQLSTWLAESRDDLVFPHSENCQPDVFVAHCPERVLPGHIMRELVENDRIIGGITQQCAEKAKALYEVFVQGDCIITNSRTAEMAKLTENSFRDVNIAFANELSVISDELDINVWELIKLANRHPRVNILQPGPGVGGHCIAVDPWFIVSKTPEKARLIKTARIVNDDKPEWVIGKVSQAIINSADNLEKLPKNVSVACLGLSFKPNIDDLRESPALSIVEKLASQHKGSILAVEPNISQLPASLSQHDHVTLCSLEQALEQADVLVLLVDHDEFKKVPAEALPKWVVDTRGVWA